MATGNNWPVAHFPRLVSHGVQIMKITSCAGIFTRSILVCMTMLASQLYGQNYKTPVPAAGGTNTAAANTTTTTKPHDDGFQIGADDVLAINVWKEPEISRSVPVRSDGKVSLPLVGEVQASGQTPKQLETEISKKLTNYISEPEVTVIVQQIKSQRFNILGQVTKPGTYPLSNPTTVLDAIALAGGFRDFAKKKSIYVLRQTPDGSSSRLPFNYKDVIKGKDPQQNIRLEPRDTVYVP
jgi:polysaccharide biosynthesis/export protein